MAAMNASNNHIENNYEMEFDPDVYEKLKEAMEPTEEELKREFTQKELEKLCLKVPCYVKMTWWNSVHDCFQSLQRKGRLQGKTEKQKLKLLAKGVNRYKPECVYSDKDIQSDQQENWRRRKKRNIERLEYFESKEASFSEEISNLLNPSISHESTVDTNISESISTENNAEQFGNGTIKNKMEPPKMVKRNSRCTPEQKNTESSSELITNSELLDDLLRINSESMTMSSQNILSQPFDYNEFDQHIPLTSTQSQSEEIHL